MTEWDLSVPLELILQTESVFAHYQPILSVKRKSIQGYEALGRGQDPTTQVSIHR